MILLGRVSSSVASSFRFADRVGSGRQPAAAQEASPRQEEATVLRPQDGAHQNRNEGPDRILHGHHEREGEGSNRVGGEGSTPGQGLSVPYLGARGPLSRGRNCLLKRQLCRRDPRWVEPPIWGLNVSPSTDRFGRHGQRPLVEADAPGPAPAAEGAPTAHQLRAEEGDYEELRRRPC